MAIVLFTGTPGSGKSLNTINEIVKYLSNKKMVIANFPLKFSERQKKKGWDKLFFYWPNKDITIDNLLSFAIDNGMIEKKQENQCLVVIDEAGGKFNSRTSMDSGRMEWIDFFSQHRKVGYSFILVAQGDRMIDRQIRGLIETEFQHRKVNRFGMGAFIPFPLFVCVENWYTARQRVGHFFFMLNKNRANMYDSMAMFEGFRLSASLMAKIKQTRGEQVEINPATMVSVDCVLTDTE